ncbi:sugar kinase [Conexibacter woesei]|uniref:PfkB domain protein n=1 Tax=Conexibacter woesei (strain DSM 14684 / CCUG 47730 / CIP 108061 / JCM 11494 / NBRC 100937 / ID131577) TaxID=469383 RepID=D3F9Z4_CONWI|nr:sugar kinase [Conexibacter woesei]ADB53089.1 PfkB domain protein [Conexibacter woesei DSM 14684]
MPLPAPQTPGLVTLGESLALLTTREPERLRHAHELVLAVGGAESNTAIGVSRLDAPATWIGRVGADELGELVVRTLRAERVRVAATVDPEVPTSLMLKERPSATSARVSYYRAGGPGARLRPGDLDRELIAGAGVLHLTGITPALSPSARETVHAAVAIAREAGVPVSFDVNYRSKLWAPADAAPELLALAALADHVFVGHDEAQALGWPGDPAALGAWLRGAGASGEAAAARVVVVKLGADGALAVTAEGTHPVAPVPIVPVDPVGAGDAFAAGYLAELLAGAPLAVRLRTAATCGAAACTTRGDWEALPTRAELARLDAPEEVVR